MEDEKRFSPADRNDTSGVARGTAGLDKTQRRARQMASEVRRQVKELGQEVTHMSELTPQVAAQTRVLKGGTHCLYKTFSVLDTHTDALRKGKAADLSRFRKVVKNREAENQLVTDCEVCVERVADQVLSGTLLGRHRALFGRPPEFATPDGGFASAANERQAQDLGVKHVAPLRHHHGNPRSSRSALRSRWLHRARYWRTGLEGLFNALKRRHGMHR